jgi:O-antigen ligase
MLVIALLAGMGAMGALPSLPTTVIQRFADVLPTIRIPDIATVEVTDTNFAAIERLAHWGAALAMWRDHLWLGVGFGNYAAVYPPMLSSVGSTTGHAHNYYLNVGAETGLLGLVAASSG